MPRAGVSRSHSQAAHSAKANGRNGISENSARTSTRIQVQKAVQHRAPSRLGTNRIGRDVHRARSRRCAAPRLASWDLMTIGQKRLIVEPRVIAQLGVQTQAGVVADKAVATDAHRSDVDPSAIDAIAQGLGVRTDAGVIANRQQIPGPKERRVKRAAAPDPRPKSRRYIGRSGVPTSAPAPESAVSRPTSHRRK